MKTVTSVSGGKSSAYIAANYPSDFLVFALVCIEDRNCTPKDKKLVQMVSDRIVTTSNSPWHCIHSIYTQSSWT